MAKKKGSLSSVIVEHAEDASTNAKIHTATTTKFTPLMSEIEQKLKPLTIEDESSKQPGKLPKTPSATSATTTPTSSSLPIYPVAYYDIHSLAFNPSVWETPSYERSYLLDSLQRQHKRSQGLMQNLAVLHTRLASVHSKNEARKLTKKADALRAEIAKSCRQEQMILLRLEDMMQGGSHGPMTMGSGGQEGLYQQSPPSASYAAAAWTSYSVWNAMMLPLYSPEMEPVSPLTPLPAGLYHPPPAVPSPLSSPYWPGTQYLMNGMGSNGLLYYSGLNFQTPGVSPPSCRVSLENIGEHAPRHRVSKSVDIAAPAKTDKYTGRRWSHADVFSPQPKDKRMSMPGLQTIWKGKESEEQQEANEQD